MSGVVTIVTMIVGGVLANTEISIDARKLIDILPCGHTIIQYIIKYAAHTVILVKKSVNQYPIVYITCDRRNKKGGQKIG